LSDKQLLIPKIDLKKINKVIWQKYNRCC